jgi:hypothetical protein
MGWAIFWAIFSQTHLVTLIQSTVKSVTTTRFIAMSKLVLQTISTVDSKQRIVSTQPQGLVESLKGQLFLIGYVLQSGLPDFSRHNLPARGKCTQLPQNIPYVHKIYQMAVK